jgi:hypothetical protein
VIRGQLLIDMRSAVTEEETSNRLHSEIQSVVELTQAHNTKVYMSGPLFRRLERNVNGTAVNGAEWEEVWAQLGGTTLALWDMKLVRKASEEGREEHAMYTNVTDSVSAFIMPTLRSCWSVGKRD